MKNFLMKDRARDVQLVVERLAIIPFGLIETLKRFFII
jgi:hypothetical protein